MPGLIDLLAGGSPTAPEEVQGAIAGTLASDPSRLAYSSGPVGMALGQLSGGFQQSQAVDAARQIAAAHQAAMPALMRAYTSDDPHAAIANDPNAPAYAKWMMFNQTPEQVAVAKLRLAQAGLTGTQAAFEKFALGKAQAGGAFAPPAPGAASGRSTTAAVTPGGEPAASANAPFQFPGRLTPGAPAAAPGTAAATTPGTAPETAPAAAEDVLAKAQTMATPEARQNYIKTLMLNPAQLFKLRQQLALQKMQRAAAPGRAP